jgi:hypothetical protein
MTSAGTENIPSVVSYGDFATEMRPTADDYYETVGWLTLTATGDDWGWTDVTLNYVRFDG